MTQKDTGINKTRLVVQYDDHPKFMSTVLCSLMEHQSLVDMAIRCGNQTLHAHKVILASNSPYFREQLENNPDTEQIIINGMDFSTLKCIIEFIYCGETSILEENLKYVVAAAKLFQIRGLQAIGSEAPDGEEIIYYPPPIFINQKPKYSTAYVPYSQVAGPSKRLHLEDNPDYRMNNSEEYMSELDPLPLQVVNYTDLHPENSNLPHMNVYDMSNMHFPGEKPIDQIKDVFSPDMDNNLEIMYKTPDGKYLKVSNEVLENYAENSMQYQVMDGDLSRQMADGQMTSPSTDNLRNVDNEDLSQTFQIEDGSLDQLDQPGTDHDGTQDHEHDDYNSQQYYGEGNYHEQENMEPTDKSDIDLLLHFQSQNRQSHGISENEALRDLHSLEQVVDVHAAGNIDGQDGNEHEPTIIINNDTPFMDASELHQHHQVPEDENQDALVHQIRSMQFYSNMDNVVYDNGPDKIEDAFGHHDDSEAINENGMMQPNYNKDDGDISVIGVEPLAGVGHIAEGTEAESQVGEVVDFMINMDSPPQMDPI